MVASLEEESEEEEEGPRLSEGEEEEEEGFVPTPDLTIYLHSDIPAEQATDLLYKMQAVSDCLNGFSYEEVSALTSFLTSVRFSFGELIMEQGESARWSGLIVSGKVEAAVEGREHVSLPAGVFIGEGSMWEHRAKRAGTLIAASEGVMLLLTRHGLEALMSDHPVVGCKLTRLLAKSAFAHWQNDARHMRLSKLRCAMRWRATARTKMRRTSPPAATGQNLALLNALKAHGINHADSMLVCQSSMYHQFHAEEVLVQPLSPFTYLLFILEGSVLVENLGLLLTAPAALHAVEYFSNTTGGCCLAIESFLSRHEKHVLYLALPPLAIGCV